MGNDNVAGDFTEAINQITEKDQKPRGMPPLHPNEKEKWVNLAEDDPLPGMPDHNLLQLPQRKLQARYRRFNLGDDLEVEELESIQSRCLEGNGWILAREEWISDKEGNTFAIIKYLEPDKKKKTSSAE